ncbi:MAG: proprotein convertase P-domain-containing protein [Actinomycetota bacterium]
MSRRLTVIVFAVAALLALPALAVAALFSSGNQGRLIPDANNGGGVLSKIRINSDARIRDLNVRVRIAHPADDDLNIYLVSPKGEFVELSTDNGGNGDDYGAGANSCAGSFTVFNDESPVSIRNGAPPFLGSFRPQSPLSAVDGDKLGGTWRLQIFDDGTGQTGVLGCWQMKVKVGG